MQARPAACAPAAPLIWSATGAPPCPSPLRRPRSHCTSPAAGAADTAAWECGTRQLVGACWATLLKYAEVLITELSFLPSCAPIRPSRRCHGRFVCLTLLDPRSHPPEYRSPSRPSAGGAAAICADRCVNCCHSILHNELHIHGGASECKDNAPRAGLQLWCKKPP